MIRAFLLCFLALSLGTQPGLTQSESRTNEQLRTLSKDGSKIGDYLHELSDRFGARLTGSPELAAARQWAMAELKRIGAERVRLEPWDFGSPGWRNDRIEVRAVSPYRDTLVAEVMAWTPGTNGPISAEVVSIVPPERPTAKELDAFLAGYKQSVRGKIVLTGKHILPGLEENRAGLRLSPDELERLYQPERPRIPASRTNDPEILTQIQIDNIIDRFLKSNAALVRIYGSREPNGIIRTYVNRSRKLNEKIPSVILRNEDFGRIFRLLSRGTRVRLNVAVSNTVFPEGKTEYNLIGEIPGTDKRDELVMFGAHLDSHHLASGATDNAVGCAIVLESFRIIKMLGIQPRRTIRLALWSGEEQGVLGSQAYVRKNFGSAEEPKPDFDKLNAYLNIDTGSGRIRGMRVFGPSSAGTMLKEILSTQTDLGVVGATTYSNRTAPGSDHAAFSVNGLPGVYIDQDPLDYGRISWHTNVDSFERIVLEDARQASIVIAWVVLQLSTRNERLPRFEEMPPRNWFPERSIR